MSPHSIALCSFSSSIFVSSGWLLDLKTEKSSRSPPLLLNTPGVCSYDTINYCNIAFLFLACGFVRKKKHLSFIEYNYSELPLFASLNPFSVYIG